MIAREVVDTREIRIAAGLKLVADGSYASHYSAAHLYDVPVPGQPDVHVSVPSPFHRSRVTGVRTHRAFEDPDLRRVNGNPVSSPVQLFLELSGVLALVDLVVVGDNLVRHGRASIEELKQASAVYAGDGARKARRAADLVREEVDSPMETRLRLLIVFAGLPEPRVNLTLRDSTGQTIARFDLSYEKYRILIEYDGRQHAEDTVQWNGDLDRREWLDRNRWRLVVVTAKGIYQQPQHTIARIVAVMRERGMPVPVPRDHWRKHFTASR
jgi:very-short-patch-repair endonuclease